MGCSYDVLEIDCTTTNGDDISFALHVSPIIRSTCAIPNCHVTGFENGNFIRFQELKDNVASGKLEFMIENREMPPSNTDGPSLSLCDIETIRAWISAGAVNN